MVVSSRAPRFLLCLFPLLSVLASARDIPVRDTPAQGALKLHITIPDNPNPSSLIRAEAGNIVFVTVKNRGRDSVSIYPKVVGEIDDSSHGPIPRPILPEVMLTHAGLTDSPIRLTVPAHHMGNYRFVASEGSYKCKGINENKGMTVYIIWDGEPQLPGGLEEDNRHHENTINFIPHPGVHNGLALPTGNDLVASSNEAPGSDGLFVFVTGQDFPPPGDIKRPSACVKPTTVINCGEINWSNEADRRICLSSMVNTVYCGHDDVEALKFSLKNTGFSLHGETLKDNGHLFAAIYKYEGKDHKDAPKIIVAFRGTELCFRWKSVKDNWFNCIIGIDAVKYSKRFNRAYKKVMELTSGGEQRVWLTGHSQGASLALHVGRQAMLEEEEINLPTFAFNPPLAVVCWFPQIAKRVIGTMTPFTGDQFEKLSKWMPVLFVHNEDLWFCRWFTCCVKQPTQLDLWVTKMPSVKLCQYSGEVKGGIFNRDWWLGPHTLEQWSKHISPLKLKCQAFKITKGNYLNCQPLKSTEEDCEYDTEAQKNLNPEAPSRDQQALQTRPSTATTKSWATLFCVPMLALAVLSSLRRRDNPQVILPVTNIPEPDHGLWVTLTQDEGTKKKNR